MSNDLSAVLERLHRKISSLKPFQLIAIEKAIDKMREENGDFTALKKKAKPVDGEEGVYEIQVWSDQELDQFQKELKRVFDKKTHTIKLSRFLDGYWYAVVLFEHGWSLTTNSHSRRGMALGAIKRLIKHYGVMPDDKRL